MTVYYALLILALVAMLTACLFLYLEIRRFGGFGTVPQRISVNERLDVFVHHGGTEVTERKGIVIANWSFEIGHFGNG
jgi:uncharacterized membrane protein